MIPLHIRLRLVHLDGIVAAHAIVRILESLTADSPFTIRLLSVENDGDGILTESQACYVYAEKRNKHTRHLPRNVS